MLVLWGILGLVTGCGSSDDSSGSSTKGIDISGMYVVTHHTRSSSSCDAEGADLASFTHFQALSETGSGFEIVECDSADPASCPETIDAATSGRLIAAMDTPESDGWSIEIGVATEVSGCHLRFTIDRATLTGEELHVETRHYGEDANLYGSACSSGEATRRGTSMPCEEFVVVTGTRL